MWPQSVAQLEVLSSRHSVQFLPARRSAEMVETSRYVLSSSSAGIGGFPSGSTTCMIDDTGSSSMNVSEAPLMGRVSLAVETGADLAFVRTKSTRRYSNRVASKIPRSEYEGGRVLGSSAVEEYYTHTRTHSTTCKTSVR